MTYANALKTQEIVRDAGGRVIGRTKLQKIAYLLSASGLESGLAFAYRHYGPYSEDLAVAAREAGWLGLITEVEQQASWGGVYSTYSIDGQISVPVEDSPRRQLARLAASADAVELELAATAVFLALEGQSDPWAETARRKPEKAEGGRLEKAKALYRKLSQVETPKGWPKI